MTLSTIMQMKSFDKNDKKVKSHKRINLKPSELSKSILYRAAKRRDDETKRARVVRIDPNNVGRRRRGTRFKYDTTMFV